MSAVAGVLPRVIAAGDGIMSWEQISRAIRPKIYYRAQTALVCRENTHNMAGGTVYPTRLAQEICDQAHDGGLQFTSMDRGSLMPPSISARTWPR